MIQLPSNWNQLSLAQMLLIAPIVLPFMREKTDKKAKAVPIPIMMQVVESLLPTDAIETYLNYNPLEINILCKKTMPFFYELPTKKPFQTIAGYLLPCEGFTRLCGIEYSFFNTFSEKGDLAGMVACVCRIERTDIDFEKPFLYPFWDGDRREIFSPENIEFRKKVIECVPAADVILTVLYLLGSRRLMMKKFKTLFKKSEIGKDFSSQLGFTGTILDMAGAKFGDFTATQYTPLYTLLTALAKAEADYERERIDSKGK